MTCGKLCRVPTQHKCTCKVFRSINLWSGKIKEVRMAFKLYIYIGWNNILIQDLSGPDISNEKIYRSFSVIRNQTVETWRK